jgi:hypothetical protein
MTRYDPFAYGEVRLDPNQKKDKEPSAAEDMLFETGEEVKQAPPADASWALLDEAVEDLLPGAQSASKEADAFGADVLGENALGFDALGDPLTDPSMMSLQDLDDASPDQQSLPSIMAEASRDMGKVSETEDVGLPREDTHLAASNPVDSPKSEAVRVAEVRPGSGAPSKSVREFLDRPYGENRQPIRPFRKSAGVVALAVPLMVFAAGGSVSAYLLMMQSNPVMASLLGAATLVGSLFARMFLRG